MHNTRTNHRLHLRLHLLRPPSSSSMLSIGIPMSLRSSYILYPILPSILPSSISSIFTNSTDSILSTPPQYTSHSISPISVPTPSPPLHFHTIQFAILPSGTSFHVQHFHQLHQLHLLHFTSIPHISFFHIHFPYLYISTNSSPPFHLHLHPPPCSAVHAS